MASLGVLSVHLVTHKSLLFASDSSGKRVVSMAAFIVALRSGQCVDLRTHEILFDRRFLRQQQRYRAQRSKIHSGGHQHAPTGPLSCLQVAEQLAEHGVHPVRQHQRPREELPCV